MRPNIVNPIAALMLLFAPLLTTGCTNDPLELPGPYDIYTQGISVANPEEPGRPIPGEIFAPSVDGGNSIAAGPFELVVFMPGFGATYSGYSPIISHLATHGAIVIGMNFITSVGFDGKHDTLARQTTYVIDYALAEESPLAGHVDVTKIATAGHSLGGKISFYSAAIDPRVTVVMAMDPSNSGGPPCFIAPDFCNAYPVAPNIVTGDIGMLDQVNAASFIMRAAPDPLFNPDEQSNAKYFFYGLDGAGLHGVKAPALYFDVGNASHACWLLCPDIIRISKRTLVAWLKAYFHGQCMEPYFTGEVIQKDIDAGYVVAVATRYCRHRP